MTTKQSNPRRAVRAISTARRTPPTLEVVKRETSAQHAARIRAALELLDSWMNVSEEEAEEQRETGRMLREAMPRHFPPDA